MQSVNMKIETTDAIFRDNEYNSLYEFYQLGVDENDLPFILHEDAGFMHSQTMFYFRQDTFKVILRSEFFRAEYRLWASVFGEMSSLEDLNPEYATHFRHVGRVLRSLLIKGAKVAYLCGAEVSLDRLVQL